MKQLVPRVQRTVGFGSAQTRWPVLGAWDIPLGGNGTCRVPMPWAVTVQELVLTSGDGTRLNDIAVTLMKNDSVTALTKTLPQASNGPVSDLVNAVSYAALDDCEWLFGGLGPFLGNTIGWCATLVSQGNVFGIPATTFGSCAVGSGGVGGALGNGFFQTYDASVTGLSTTYSICAIPCTLDTIAMKAFGTPPSGGASWKGYVRVMRPGDPLPVLQDGAGGSIDSLTEITSGNSTAIRSGIGIHLEPGDIVETLYVRAGSDHPNENFGQVGIGIGVIPDDDDYYMLTGGSSQVQTDGGYAWIMAAQNELDELLAQAPIGPGGFIARGLFVRGAQAGVNPTDEVTNTLRRSGQDTSITVARQQLEQTALITGQRVRFVEGHFIDLRSLVTGGAGDVTDLYWGLAVAPLTEEDRVIGPLAWVHIRRRVPNVSPAEFVTETYSDMDMQCPADWENGFKEGLVVEWGEVRRPSSHLFTGEWQGTTFSFQLADREGRFRAKEASLVDRYWLDATVRMTTRQNRADLGVPFTVFCGPVIDVQPTSPLLLDVTLGDIVSQSLLSDQAQVPWRKISDGFLDQMDEVSSQLDLDQAEPILYGTHNRVPGDTSPAGDSGFRVKPIYLGIWGDYHEWMIAGHACADVRNIYVDGVARDESFGVFSAVPTWIIPHHPFHDGLHGASYRDYSSSTYGNLRRYTIMAGKVGRTEPDAVALGEMELTVDVDGIEDVGDGSGALITDRFEQYKHFLINFVANQGLDSYQSGPWLANPTWSLFDGEVDKVDEDSVDAARTIGEDRLLGGYVGAAAIVNRTSVKTAIANWNRSCACRFGITHNGQMRIFLVHPTQAAKDAAVLYTDAYEILDGSFATEISWDQHATSIPWVTDFDQVSGTWRTSGRVFDQELIDNYGGTDRPSETREYPYAPGREQAEHLAILELRIRKHRPRYIRLDATIGPVPVTDDSLGYRDIGDYIRVECFDAVQETREIRLHQVIDPGVRVGSRRVNVIAMDVEDLIDYDLDSSPSPLGSP